MNVHFFKEKISKDSVEKAAEWLFNLQGNPGTFILDSDGGEADYAEILLELLNQCPDVEVMAVGAISSAAFDVFVRCENAKSMGPYLRYGMVHLPSASIGALGVRKPFPDNPANLTLELTARAEEAYKDFYKDLLTEEEFKWFVEGYEVYLSSDRVAEIVAAQYQRQLVEKHGSNMDHTGLTDIITSFVNNSYAEEQVKEEAQGCDSKES